MICSRAAELEPLLGNGAMKYAPSTSACRSTSENTGKSGKVGSQGPAAVVGAGAGSFHHALGPAGAGGNSGSGRGISLARTDDTWNV
jgi:hypothetical protein